MSIVTATHSRGVLSLPAVKNGLLLYAPLRKDSLAVSFDVAKHMETPITETGDADRTFIARKDPWYVTDATLNKIRCEKEGYRNDDLATNLCLRSEELATNPPWVPTNALVTANDTTAPDGNNTADKVADNGAAAEIHQIFAGGTLTDNLVYAKSVFAKEGTAVEFTLAIRDDGAAVDRARSDFQWVGGALTIKAQDVGTALARKIGRAGWYRATIIVPINQIVGANAHRILIYPTEDGGGAVGLYHYFWGVQFEQKAFSRSYIPTVAASVIGSAGSLAYDNAGDKHAKPAAGTMMFAVTTLYDSGEHSPAPYCVATVTLAPGNGILVYVSPVGLYTYNVQSGGAVVANITSITAASRHVTHILAVRWAANDFRIYVDGVEENSDLVGAAPAAMNDISFGFSVVANRYSSMNIAYFAVYDRLLNITEIQLNTREFAQWLQS